ncbi:hypothetical protein [Streptomyces hoynatensis]|uniref:Type II toxin-antitoxin system RelE/ParE family toxin n=1 Tax=Streptomyces hoynatensis TaxID=1141874 RepID=A0A3A9YL49_9ACTN|nr:hypothetical protein [Streptomyces hoynatensis]RKN34967.1 hypothetical protein D7294_31330 [Streptomyces hoynatensis]
MTYRLKYDPGVEQRHDALPERAAEALTTALAAACDDPLGHTEPFGEPDATMRLVTTPWNHAVLFLAHSEKTAVVVEIGP